MQTAQQLHTACSKRANPSHAVSSCRPLSHPAVTATAAAHKRCGPYLAIWPAECRPPRTASPTPAVPAARAAWSTRHVTPAARPTEALTAVDPACPPRPVNCTPPALPCLPHPLAELASPTHLVRVHLRTHTSVPRNPPGPCVPAATQPLTRPYGCFTVAQSKRPTALLLAALASCPVLPHATSTRAGSLTLPATRVPCPVRQRQEPLPQAPLGSLLTPQSLTEGC